MNFTGFDDMANDLDFAFANPHKEVKVLYTEPCKACRGTGRYNGPSSYGSHCFQCGGKGFHEYKTSPEYRKARAEKTVAKKAQAEQDRQAARDAWHVANKEVSNWLIQTAPRWDFAANMLDAVAKYGALTEAQMAAIQRCIERDIERKAQWAAERAAREAAAPQVNATKLEDAFRTAKSNGLKWPKIKIAGVKVSPASETSKNAGALYVKEGDTYLGKVLGGRFFKSRDCGTEQEGIVVNLINDPKGYAEAYGLRTGQCCICSRELTNKESIDRGIGPICAEKFGW